MASNLRELTRFINGEPVRHLALGKDLSLVSVQSTAQHWITGFLHGCKLNGHLPTRIIAAFCTGSETLAATSLAWTTTMRFLLARPDAYPDTAIQQACRLIKEAGFPITKDQFACAAIWLDCTTNQLRLAHTANFSLTCLRKNNALQLDKMDSQVRSKDAALALVSNCYLLEPGDKILWQADASDRQPFLLQTVEKTSFEFKKTLKLQNETEVGDAIISLSDTLSAKLEAAGFDSAGIRANLILEEGILNAWKHGNKQDPAKKIQIRWRIGIDCILEIENEGPGFDFSKLEDPRTADNLLKLSGRGIFIIRYYAGAIAWEKEGRLIRITIHPTIEQDGSNLHYQPDLVEYWTGIE